MALIACKNTALGYGGHAVVEGLGFQVNPGDYLCVIGENGAGKSTLMRTLLHLQPPLSGEITLGDGLRANEIGYLPQQTPVQRDFPASVREIVQSGCLNGCGLRPFYNRAEKRRAAESMERLGIAPLAGTAIGSCPAGSSSGCCWPGLCARLSGCCCWMSRWRGWIPRPAAKCMPWCGG